MAQKKTVLVYHGSNFRYKTTIHVKKGKHLIFITKEEYPYEQLKHIEFKGTFVEAVKSGKQRALKLGKGTRIYTYGASNNTTEYIVAGGKIVKLESYTE